MANTIATSTFTTRSGTATLEVGPKQPGTGYSATLTAPGQPPVTFYVNTLEQLQAKLAAHGLPDAKVSSTSLPGPSLQPSVSIAGKKPADAKPKEASQQQIFAACDALHIPIPAKMTPAFKAEVKEKVIAYQKQLFAEGYDVGAKGFDGIYGPDTAAAAKAKAKNDSAQPTDGYATTDAGIEKQFAPYKTAVETADKGNDLQAKIDAREKTAKHLHGLDAALAKKIALTKDPKEKAHLEAKRKEIAQTLATPPMSDLAHLKSEQALAGTKAVAWSDANGPKPKVYQEYESARATLVKQHAAAKSPAEQDALAKKISDLDAAATMYQATSQSVGKDTTEKALKAKVDAATAAPKASKPEYAQLCDQADAEAKAADACMAKGDKAGAEAHLKKATDALTRAHEKLPPGDAAAKKRYDASANGVILAWGAQKGISFDGEISEAEKETALAKAALDKGDKKTAELHLKKATDHIATAHKAKPAGSKAADAKYDAHAKALNAQWARLKA